MLNLQADRRDLHGDRLLIRGGGRGRCRLLAECEIRDVGDGTDRLVGPDRVHAGPGRDTCGARSPTSTACSKEVSAPSSLISAQANGLASGCPSSGSGCQDQDWTVPTLDTGTTSVNGA